MRRKRQAHLEVSAGKVLGKQIQQAHVADELRPISSFQKPLGFQLFRIFVAAANIMLGMLKPALGAFRLVI